MRSLQQNCEGVKRTYFLHSRSIQTVSHTLGTSSRLQNHRIKQPNNMKLWILAGAIGLLALFMSISEAANVPQGPDEDHTEVLSRHRRWGPMGWMGLFGRQTTACYGTVCLDCDLLNICGNCYDLIKETPCTQDYSSGCRYYCCQSMSAGGNC